ncbi:hypothetical protein GCM10009547_45300 [Sporichthya brevicatena]|uniref:Uncharacterized protein n=1 Tax=Sporichthya brevicatena TaxID=171442 RepID=A0ABN1HAV3_9ACTN
MAETVRWDDEQPWQQRQTRTLGALAALGLIGLGVCWYFLSGEPAYQDQVPWLVGAITCVLVMGVVMAYWLLIGVRTVHAGSSETSQVLRVETLDPRRRARVVSGARDSDVVFVATASMTRLHRDTCLLVRGKQVSVVSAADAAARGLRLCGACNR